MYTWILYLKRCGSGVVCGEICCDCIVMFLKLYKAVDLAGPREE
jgi:hypothetical protein